MAENADRTLMRLCLFCLYRYSKQDVVADEIYRAGKRELEVGIA